MRRMIEDVATPDPLIDLARDICRSEGPSRLLDCRIWLVVGADLGHTFSAKGVDPMRPGEIICGRWFGSALAKFAEDVEGVATSWRVPRFTTSLDAAATLFPAGIGHCLHHPVDRQPGASSLMGDRRTRDWCAANGPMALSAAGLHARRIALDGL